MSFVTINNTSIKVSNIKNFGISSDLKNEVVFFLMKKKALPREKKRSTVTRIGGGIFKNVIANVISATEGGGGGYISSNRIDYELIKDKIMAKKYLDISNRGYTAGDDGPEYSAYFMEDSKGDIVEFHNLDRDTRFGFEGSVTNSKIVKCRYLYITTFQNDNYKFYDYEIDVDKEHKNLLNLTK